MALGQGPRRAALFVTWTSGNDCSPYQVRKTKKSGEKKKKWEYTLCGGHLCEGRMLTNGEKKQ